MSKNNQDVIHDIAAIGKYKSRIAELDDLIQKTPNAQKDLQDLESRYDSTIQKLDNKLEEELSALEEIGETMPQEHHLSLFKQRVQNLENEIKTWEEKLEDHKKGILKNAAFRYTDKTRLDSLAPDDSQHQVAYYQTLSGDSIERKLAELRDKYKKDSEKLPALEAQLHEHNAKLRQVQLVRDMAAAKAETEFLDERQPLDKIIADRQALTEERESLVAAKKQLTQQLDRERANVFEEIQETLEKIIEKQGGKKYTGRMFTFRSDVLADIRSLQEPLGGLLERYKLLIDNQAKPLAEPLARQLAEQEGRIGKKLQEMSDKVQKRKQKVQKRKSDEVVVSDEEAIIANIVNQFNKAGFTPTPKAESEEAATKKLPKNKR